MNPAACPDTSPAANLNPAGGARTACAVQCGPIASALCKGPHMRFVPSLAWSNTRRAWTEPLAGGFLLLGAVALAGLGSRMPPAYRVTLWSLFGLALAVLLRRGWVRLFGPVLFYELPGILRPRL